MIVPVVTEVVRRSAANPTQLLAAGNAIATVSNGILGPNTLLFYGMVCGLSASVGATVMSILKVVWEAMEHLVCKDTSPAAQEELFLFGVDVSNSEYLTRPEVVRAAEYAAVAHKGQMRKTQDPYIVHCIETACIVEALLNVSEPDSRAETAVIAALLHDVTDDTNLTKLDVLTAFGSEVADMVEKVSQLSQMNQLVRRQTRQTAGQRSKGEQDQLRNMILKMVEEPLVIVIKLADRLHNMRTVYALKPEKQRAVATETMQIWCSLAERLGMFALKSELEDLCFAVLHPAEYRALRSELDAFWGLQSIPNFSLSPEAQAFLGGADTGGASTSGRSMHSSDDSFLSPEQREAKELIASVLPFDALMFKSQRHIPPSARRGLEVLEVCARRLLREIQIEPYATGLDVQVQGRLKSVHSMCRKMGRKGVTLDKIYDARALRVVVDDEGGAKHQEAVQACYDLLSTVRRLWRPVQGETDDYIQNPKPSGYQSLHAAVIGPGGVPMEIQIRTSSMHENAEYGAAAHWAYKENTPKQPGAGVEDIQEGQPVLRVSPAKLRKGVVVRREAGLNGAPYKDIMAYVKEKQWFAAGHGDLHVYLEEYALMKDGRYHRMDHMGFKHRNTTITPMQAYHELEKAAQVAQAVAASKAPEAAAAPEKRLERSESKAFLREQRQLEEKTRLMRSMLEWNREMDSGGGQVGGKTTDVMVLMWPSNEIALLPRGTTAVDIMRLQGKSDALGVPSTFGWVNVNNQLVPAATPLQDGDLVVLSSEILEI
ncbi:hypothetical protein WJX72_007743 [[Myrmecia] bisecta]|uniref:GTP diphosphokinase n=1 Tax=[Myrmecia] bisecta TaxID=41462 RepID=A0AAW1Q7H8_9CHLO